MLNVYDCRASVGELLSEIGYLQQLSDVRFSDGLIDLDEYIRRVEFLDAERESLLFYILRTQTTKKRVKLLSSKIPGEDFSENFLEGGEKNGGSHCGSSRLHLSLRLGHSARKEVCPERPERQAPYSQR